MQFKNMLKKLSVALIALVAVSTSQVSAAQYASGTQVYIQTGFFYASLTGQYNMYTASDLLTNGTLVANTALMQHSLDQQVRLMDVRLSQLSSTQKMASADRGTHYVALAGNGSEVNKGQAAGSEGHNFGVWLSGRYSDFKNTHQYAGVSGNGWTGLLGGDYKVHSCVIVGLAFAYEHVDAKTKFLKEKITNDGYGVNPYVKFLVNDWLDVDLFGGYQRITTKTNHENMRHSYNFGGGALPEGLRAGKVSGKTHSNQYFGVLAVNAHTVVAQALTVAGKVGVNYITRQQNAFKQKFSFSTANMYDDSNVRGLTTTQSQAFGEGRLGYMVTENIEPYIKGGYAYDLSYKKYGTKEYLGGKTVTGDLVKFKTDRSSYTYGGGVGFGFGQFSGGLDYERLQGARGLTSNTYMMLVRYNF